MDAIENKISELSQVYQQFETASDISDARGLKLITRCVDEVKNIYSGYTTVIHNLENACSAAGIATGQTLFQLYRNDFFYEKGGRKFSLGLFIIKQSVYHMVIPIKLTNNYKYVGTVNDRQFVSYVATNIYKPILINIRFDGRKANDIPGMYGFIGRRGSEPAKLLSVDINLNTDGNTIEFSKLQIGKIKKAIETTMTEVERQQTTAAAASAPGISPSVQQDVELMLP